MVSKRVVIGILFCVVFSAIPGESEPPVTKIVRVCDPTGSLNHEYRSRLENSKGRLIVIINQCFSA